MREFTQLDGVSILAAGEDDVSLVLADLDALAGNPEFNPDKVLTQDEQRRANAFKTDILSSRYVASKWILKIILAQLTGQEPSALDIQAGEFGKPFLKDSFIEFNLSHSANVAVVGISHNGAIGVDIESIPSGKTCLEIEQRVLTPAEADRCRSYVNGAYELEFLHYWTLKEAMLKASGEGLSREMTELEFSCMHPAPLMSRLPESYGHPDDWDLWFMPLLENDFLVAGARCRNANLKQHIRIQ